MFILVMYDMINVEYILETQLLCTESMRHPLSPTTLAIILCNQFVDLH